MPRSESNFLSVAGYPWVRDSLGGGFWYIIGGVAMDGGP